LAQTLLAYLAKEKLGGIMKKKMVVLGMLLMLIFGLSAQSLNDEINVEIQREIEEAMKEKDEAMKIIQIKMDKNLSENSSDSFMGIYLSDMCFKDD
jgi:outer membrane lipoprotein-sorting protein